MAQRCNPLMSMNLLFEPQTGIVKVTLCRRDGHNHRLSRFLSNPPPCRTGCNISLRLEVYKCRAGGHTSLGWPSSFTSNLTLLPRSLSATWGTVQWAACCLPSGNCCRAGSQLRTGRLEASAWQEDSAWQKALAERIAVASQKRRFPRITNYVQPLLSWFLRPSALPIVPSEPLLFSCVRLPKSFAFSELR